MSLLAVGGYLAGLRARKGETQDEVAAAVGAHKRNVTAWENGERLPHVETFARLLAHLEGSARIAHELLLDGDASAKDGRAIAFKTDAEIESILTELQATPEGRARLLAAARSLSE